VAISAIELLKAFVNVGTKLQAGGGESAWAWTAHDKAIAWKVVIRLILVVSGILFASMGRFAAHNHAAMGQKAIE
jgi:uncharacterized membrane protein YqhA